MSKPSFRKTFSAPGSRLTARSSGLFRSNSRQPVSRGIRLTDCLMSGLAMFGLKYPSLLQFDQDQRRDLIRSNLKSLCGIERVPCDTYLWERLDELDPRPLRKSYRRLLQVLQRGKGLEDFAYLEGHYLLAVGGTGYFSSSEVFWITLGRCCASVEEIFVVQVGVD